MKATRRSVSRRAVWFILAGIVIILFDIAIINWTPAFPLGVGGPVWSIVLTLGIMLIITSPSLAKVSPAALSRIPAEQLEKWEASGDVVTVIENLSQEETLTLLGFTRRHFGKYVAKTWTTPKGKIWRVKLWRVGDMILPAGRDKGKLVFKVVLFRRDLGGQKEFRRLVRTILKDTNPQLVKPGPLVELPNWFAE